ncbi:MAG: terminase small subunit [Pseudomonadales bacterium]|nr:terminase small subunit [Pseudomonadales bacterium]
MLELTKAQVAELCRVSTRTVVSWGSEPDFPQPERRGKANIYDAAAVLEWAINREIQRRIDSEDGEYLDLAQERARLARTQRRRQELLLAQERGQAVLVEDVAAAVADQYGNVRARLLSLPAKLAPLAHTADSVAAIRAVLEEGVHDALAELSEGAVAPGAVPAEIPEECALAN